MLGLSFMCMTCSPPLLASQAFKCLRRILRVQVNGSDKMSSSSSQRFRTHAMPACIFPSSAAALQGSRSSPQDGCNYAFELEQRRLSSLGCSTTAPSSSSSWFSRNSRRRLPFASITGEHAGSIGQLRWLSSSGSSSSSSTQQPANASKVPPPPGTPASIKPDPKAFAAAAEAATAPDVFKAGDVIGNGRYKLLDKLGSGPHGVAEGIGEGRFTTLWNGQELATGQEVVLKLVEAGDAVSYVAGTREAALHALAGRHPNIVALLDAFEHRSKQGRHACMVLEKAGSNLEVVTELWKMESFGRLPPAASAAGLEALRSIARQSLTALDHLHTRGLIHMDISPDNILLDKPFQPLMAATTSAVMGDGWGLKRVRGYWHVGMIVLGLDKQMKSLTALEKELNVGMAKIEGEVYHDVTLPQATVKLTDFGRAVPYKQLAAQAPGLLGYNKDGVIVLGNPGLRPPEEVLGMDYAAPAYDIWRLGCTLYEIATGEVLFGPELWENLRKAQPKLLKYSNDAIHLMDMQTSLGLMPREFIRKSPLFDNFFVQQTDMLRVTNTVDYVPGAATLFKCIMRRTEGTMKEKDIHQLAEFLESMLIYDPSKRPSAAELLQHKWLQVQEDSSTPGKA